MSFHVCSGHFFFLLLSFIYLFIFYFFYFYLFIFFYFYFIFIFIYLFFFFFLITVLPIFGKETILWLSACSVLIVAPLLCVSPSFSLVC